MINVNSGKGREYTYTHAVIFTSTKCGHSSLKVGECGGVVTLRPAACTGVIRHFCRLSVPVLILPNTPQSALYELVRECVKLHLHPFHPLPVLSAIAHTLPGVP